MKTKKLLLVLASVLSCCLMFNACSKNKQPDNDSSSTVESSSQVESSSESESSSEAESSSENESSSEAESSSESESSSEAESSSEVESSSEDESSSEVESSSEADSSSEKPSEVTFEVTFECDGLVEIAKQVVVEGEKAQEPTLSLGENYVFEGWSVNGEPFDFDTEITEDTVITLEYSRLYTVSFDCGEWEGLSISAVKVKDGETVEMPTLPASQTYEFVAWLLDGKAFSFDTPITSDITLVLDCQVYGSIV